MASFPLAILLTNLQSKYANSECNGTQDRLSQGDTVCRMLQMSPEGIPGRTQGKQAHPLGFVCVGGGAGVIIKNNVWKAELDGLPRIFLAPVV